MSTIHVERVRAPAKLRFFFVGLGLFAIAIAAIAFVPEYLRYLTGRFPIAPELHVHGVLMVAWLVMFTTQAWLGSTGRIALHRRTGSYGVAFGILVGISMVFVELRVLVAHPLPTDWTGYDELLQDVYAPVTFVALLLWAAHERRRPTWHKRLMAIATFTALLAPIERLEWLPELGIGFVFASVFWLDLCLIIPLVAYDFIDAKRAHPATVRGLLLMLGAQATMVLAWGTAPWRNIAFAVAHAVRAAVGM